MPLIKLKLNLNLNLMKKKKSLGLCLSPTCLVNKQTEKGGAPPLLRLPAPGSATPDTWAGK